MVPIGVNLKLKPYHRFPTVFFLCLLITLFHIFNLYIDRFDLYADEAQYWTWAQNPDWGYYSKPPVVAWIIAATTEVCGDNAFCIRLGSPILHFLTSLVMFALGKKLFTDRVGAWCAYTYATLPGITVSANLISTDPPLLFFWALSLYFLISGLKDWSIKWWILLGFSLGLGLLSKYNMIMFAVSAMLYFAISKENRIYLFSFKFWLALVIAFLVYLPNFLWNYANGFASYSHTKDNANLSGFTLHFDKFIEFFAAQFAVFGPLLFATLVFLLIFHAPLLLKKEKNVKLTIFILPMLMVILAISLLSRAHANWAAPIYVPATLLVINWLLSTHKAAIAKLSLCLHILVIVIFYNFQLVAFHAGFTLTPEIDPFKRLRGWTSFSDQVSYYNKLFSDGILLSDERKTVATLKYYLRDFDNNPADIYKWNADKIINDHYDMTTDMNTKIGRNFLLVTRTENIKNIRKYFASAKKVGNAKVALYDDYAIDYNVYYMRNFKGY